MQERDDEEMRGATERRGEQEDVRNAKSKAERWKMKRSCVREVRSQHMCAFKRARGD